MTEEAGSLDAAASEPAASAPPPQRSLFRRILRPWVVMSLLAVVVIAGNAWMFLTIDGWRTEDAKLREAARVAANSVGASNATIESQSEMMALLKKQADAAAAWSTDLGSDIDAAKELSDAYKGVALGFERCGDERAQAIAALWASRSASALTAAADADCAAAQAQLDALAGGN